MKFTISAVVLALSALATAMPQGANANRPVPEGACCVANTSLKQDVCTVNGVSGRCVPDSINNCKSPICPGIIVRLSSSLLHRRYPIDLH
jgi:hypothetical protein